ncbi:MAG TPA: tRNA uridine-5-carboxymethylaminomethyl(34) synthesis GTPase MnmE [Desulfobacteraceae bacterium]|nr:tRNA uridine-5-carboxymethylaminomethyl(34) synthesis GTPase MnmE [Desulfobacteraceae bacterium]
MSNTHDTIAAISTPIGTAGIGIIRISGPDAFSVVESIFRPKKRVRNLQSHHLYLGRIIDPRSGESIDEVLLTCMYAPHSFTRQDVVEINSHSGYLLLSKILRLVVNCGVRQAEPGEFTLRAFLNGRMDLTQAEAVVDLINSRSEKGLTMAALQMQGSLGKEIRQLRAEVLELSAHAETAIDFPDEDAEIMPADELADIISNRLIPRLKALIQSGASNRLWIDGVNTVLAGCVNVGKSSILNLFLDEPRAIVTPVPGTTRDIIESVISIDGLPVKLADTAGFRQAPDEVEAIGMEFSVRRLEEADLVLVVLDRSRTLQDGDIEIIERCRDKTTLIVMNKEDLAGVLDEEIIARRYPDIMRVSISARTGAGIENLKSAILRIVAESDSGSDCSHAAVNARHINALERASRSLAAAAEATRTGAPMEIIALDLSDCIGTLGEITGENTTNDLLETIFSRFCLGK